MNANLCFALVSLTNNLWQRSIDRLNEALLCLSLVFVIMYEYYTSKNLGLLTGIILLNNVGIIENKSH